MKDVSYYLESILACQSYPAVALQCGVLLCQLRAEKRSGEEIVKVLSQVHEGLEPYSFDYLRIYARTRIEDLCKSHFPDMAPRFIHA